LQGHITMKKGVALVVVLSLLAMSEMNESSFANGRSALLFSDYVRVENRAFTNGEVLKYRVHYGWLDAGVAILEVKKESERISNRDVYHVVGTGKTTGAFNWFYKVRDRYETYIDEEALVPLKFVRRVNEGGFIINQDQEFDHINNKVNSDGKILDVPAGIQDMLSAFYYARNFDYCNIVVGDEFTVNTFVDDEIFPLKIRYVGLETIKNRLGKFRCLAFHPVIQEGRVFDAEEDLTVWISNDDNHIPIAVEAKLFVGSARMDLQSYSGLANPLARLN